MTSPKDAATVAVLRDTDEGIETFMLRRDSGHEFMPDVWVFPGGRVERRDRDGELSASALGLSPRRAVREIGGDIDEKTARGLFIAAIRETFEEARLLLATDTDGRAIGADSTDDLDRLRSRLEDDEVTLREIAERIDGRFCADRLVYFAHWITPEFESRRYDTRFFATAAPPGQIACHDGGETTRGTWLSPDAALRRYRAGDFRLAPPTICVLEDFRRFDDVDELLGDLSNRSAPPVVRPQLLEEATDAPTLVLPGDPEYDADTESAASTAGITRMALCDGFWEVI